MAIKKYILKSITSYCVSYKSGILQKLELYATSDLELEGELKGSSSSQIGANVYGYGLGYQNQRQAVNVIT